jgi:hypothetical protein
MLQVLNHPKLNHHVEVSSGVGGAVHGSGAKRSFSQPAIIATFVKLKGLAT